MRPSLAFFSQIITGFQVTPSMRGDLKACEGSDPIQGTALGTFLCQTLFHSATDGATISSVPLEEDRLRLGLG